MLRASLLGATLTYIQFVSRFMLFHRQFYRDTTSLAVMTKLKFSNDDLVRVFAMRSPSFPPDHLFELDEKVTRLEERPQQHVVRNSAAGTLSRLPLELLYQICGYLDLQSLERLSRVSVRGREVVDSSLPLQELRKAVGDRTLKTLYRVGLRCHHTMFRLHTALISPTCVSCGDFGPFLHLLSVERCCYYCLINNQAFCCMSMASLSQCFLLPATEEHKLPLVWAADFETE